jgi:hypothetical protein
VSGPSDINQINNRPDKLYTLEEFVEEQERHRERTTHTNISQKVSQVCDQELLSRHQVTPSVTGEPTQPNIQEVYVTCGTASYA